MIAFILLIIGTAGLLVNEFVFDWGSVVTIVFAAVNVLGLIFLGIGVTLLVAGGMDWTTSRFAAAAEYIEPITSLLPAIPRQEGLGLHANTAGGVLTFFLPLLGSLF